MWIMTNYGVLMPADLPAQYRPRKHPEWDMQVRTRDRRALVEMRKRINAETSKIIATPEMDYEFRVYTNRHSFAAFMYDEVAAIDYTKFKPTTERRGGGGRKLHDLYDFIWYVVAKHYGSLPTRRDDTGATDE